MPLTIKEAYDNIVRKLEDKTCEIDIRSIICRVNNLEDMSSFYVHLNDFIKDENRLNRYVEEYLKGVPIAYVLKETTFLGRKFYCNRKVFIPRMETEEVVLCAIKKAKEFFNNDKPYHIYDPCSGTGIIGTTLTHELNVESIFFSDLSKDAIKLTERNFKHHFINDNRRIEASFAHSYGLSELTSHFSKNANHLIVSNPPYIIDEKIDDNVLKYEPHLALYVDKELTIYTKIVNKVIELNDDKALIVFEISDEIKPLLQEILDKIYPHLKYNFYKDINNKERILTIEVNNDVNRKEFLRKLKEYY